MKESYEVTIELITLTPLVVQASSKREARATAARLIQRDFSETPEAIGDPIMEAPHIRSVKKLGG